MVPYSGFWWRVLAYIIDSIVISVVSNMIGSVLGMSVLPFEVLDDSDFRMAAVISGAVGSSLLLSWLYFAVMESSKLQATLGKLAVGVIVTDRHGERIGFLRATGRYFAKYLSAIIFGIGFLMVAFTERKQGLHDLMAGTLVYKTRDPHELESPEGVFA